MTIVSNDPCPYGTGDGIACVAGIYGHRGAHVWPGADTGCWYYLHTRSVAPIRCTLTDGHAAEHEYQKD